MYNLNIWNFKMDPQTCDCSLGFFFGPSGICLGETVSQWSSLLGVVDNRLAGQVANLNVPN